MAWGPEHSAREIKRESERDCTVRGIVRKEREGIRASGDGRSGEGGTMCVVHYNVPVIRAAMCSGRVPSGDTSVSAPCTRSGLAPTSNASGGTVHRFNPDYLTI